MKNINTLVLAVIVVVSTLFTGCSQRLVDFTVISSKNHQISLDRNKGKKVTGKSLGFLGLGANIKDAMDKALESAGPQYDVLIDGVLKVKSYPLVSGYVVEGTAIISGENK